ncbi:MAG: DNA-cytosine methyltransferase [Candidatus Buchananbacteria bacterium RIFCSPLOWO2_01_FULL_46_12]|uniref:DNA-cytosine methyltransferase n=2 Tax=Candidatus Buchananiibacteriota TaxID=1817903 RepID=A0A1G1YPN9_9BACT|nr:MAG: DNA-cytosine methyltransferase [Candidatus Buchananbacteria bacterium RIFCSPHIGHO2_01_FULL_44_11]OGY53407.1 MAG: DNA-cytosine methyltransferase [Candidatus Buchananbacteria bacterium RIFCSPLOWO2_01_FULL_46_12]
MPLTYNQPKFKTKRKALRKNQTDAEKLLWRYLRNKKLGGFKFFRQYGVGNYIVDFYCPAARLVVEIDGGQHNKTSNQIYDKKRSEYLKQQRITVIRFWNNNVINNIEGTLEKIQEELG